MVDDKSPSEVNALVDKDDQRKVKKVRSLKDVMRVIEKGHLLRCALVMVRLLMLLVESFSVRIICNSNFLNIYSTRVR